MWSQTKIGKMLSLKLSSLLTLLVIVVDSITGLSLTAIEVPKYAKVKCHILDRF